MIAAHPFRTVQQNGLDSGLGAGLPATERFRIVDAIEVHNGLTSDRQREQAAELARILDLPTTGGSDTHRFMDVGTSFTVFEDDIKDEQDLITAIKAARCHGGDWASEGLENHRVKDLTAGPSGNNSS